VIRATVCAAATLAAVGSVRAETPVNTATPTATINATTEPASRHEGVAIGVELGEPTSITVGWWKGDLGVAAALGTGTIAGVGISFHADAQLVVTRLAPKVPLRVGLGGRFYHHGYDAMSFDEVPDSHLGVRASAAVAFESGALQLYAEVAPGIDVYRSASCTLASGAYSICPHTQELPFFVQLVLGARWFFSN
jgi:hypothetical protein